MLKRLSARETQLRRSNHHVTRGSRGAVVARKGLGWIPWQSLVSRVARGYGFIDPGIVLKRLRAFAKPSEVGEPIELLRAGVVFHARGLVNTRAIQFNLDWIWPYWIEQQFNPHSESFVPRAFSFSHINVTHRNWTAVGLPDFPHYPIVDPRGLVTPLYDGWSLDFWIIGGEEALLPSKTSHAEQTLQVGENLLVRTNVALGDRRLSSEVWVERDAQGIFCVIRIQPVARKGDQLVVAARPYNPEGVSFIDSVHVSPDQRHWTVNGSETAEFSRAPQRTALACYASGDVYDSLGSAGAKDEIECPVGMATAAAIFSAETAVEIRVPLERADTSVEISSNGAAVSWRDELATCARLQIPDDRFQRLYDAAVSTVILHSPGEVFPGPYTYRRFWYRDAAFILNALITLGARDRSRRALDLFPRGQLKDGYFRSQEGEWDSNGEVLWILDRYVALTGETLSSEWLNVIERGGRWIGGKRMRGNTPHPGLLPAGFSAEHLGPNDYYYWDDFWGVSGLRAAARMLRAIRPAVADEFDAEAEDFQKVILESIARAQPRTRGAIPAAPDRRMDSGAVGSLIADFPLQLLPPGDPRIMGTVDWLLAHSFVRDGFFQNMIHSGINAYLTLHVAQVLLRARDPRAHALIDAVATLASPTGQWPEAIHPRTLGGCMGDGQHVWAAAEWLVMMRNLFVREETNKLVLGSGLRPEWTASSAPLSFGATLTPFGEVRIQVARPRDRELILTCHARWRSEVPELEVAVPGYALVERRNEDFHLRRL